MHLQFTPSQRSRFWLRVDKLGSIPTMCPELGHCWLWQGTCSWSGYGEIQIGNQRHFKTHRLSWIWHKGDIPDGHEVCHRCDIPRCVNPDHLFLGTHQENMADAAAKGRMGHGERHYKAHLTENAVLEIRNLRGTTSMRSIAKRFGVTDTAIADIFYGITWKHVV